MNRKMSLALFLALAFATLAAAPSVSAELQPYTWAGAITYDIDADGRITVIDATPGCHASSGFESGLADNNAVALSDQPSAVHLGAGTARCIPEVPIEVTFGRRPSCAATGYAYFKPLVAGVIIGQASCGPVSNYCVGTTVTPCSVSAAYTPSNSGSCSFQGTGVTVLPPGGIRASCYVVITWT